MNVLFVLYGDLGSNSAAPLSNLARELSRRGYQCAVAVPTGREQDLPRSEPAFRAIAYGEALANPAQIFPDSRPADILHAWTPRECVRRFVTAYQIRQPTPLIIYLEDNEAWLARAALGLVGLREDVLFQHTEDVISTWTAEGLPHVLRHEHFVGLADAAVVIQDKLAGDVPPWVPCTTVMPGVDLDSFSPRPADSGLRERFGLAKDVRTIVHPGGLNDFTRPGLEALCRAVGLINERGIPCRLLRTGPGALDFFDRLPPGAADAVTDLGVLPREQIPDLLALADVFVQPGKNDPFEDLRLPGKLPELFAMGRPVVLPDANIASLLRDGVDAVIHRTGSPEEIAEKCLTLFADPQKAREIGEAGRRFAEKHFDSKIQASRLEGVYRAAREAFRPEIAAKLWREDAEQAPVSALLARRLKLLAEAGGAGAEAPAAMLDAYARCLEFAQERSRGLETGISVRDAEIASLKQEVEQRIAGIDSLRREVAARDERIAELAAQVEAGAVRIAGLNQHAASREQELSGLRQRVADQDHHIVAMQSSLSWRITGWLRLAGHWAKRMTGRNAGD